MAAIVQKALHTCSDHENEETDMYCKTCMKPVCVRCVKNEHKEHEWDSMKNVAKVLRAESNQRKLEMESISKSIVMGVSEILESVSDRTNRQFSSNCNELESTRKTLVRYVNEEIDQMKAKCEDHHKRKTEILQKQRDKLKAKENRMNFLIQEMETGATDFTDFDLIEMHEELKRLLTELHSLAEIPSDLHDDTVYTPGSFDVSVITTLLGSVEEKQYSYSPVFKHKFQYNEKKNSESTLIRICQMKQNEAWICTAGSTLLKLVDIEGNEKRSVDICSECVDFTVAENDIIYFLDANAKCIKAIDREGKITTLFPTAPLVPCSIYLSGSGDLLLSLVERESYEGKYFVRRMSRTCDVIKDYEIENDEVTSNSYDSIPWQVIEHFNGNIGILMWYCQVQDLKFSTIFSIDREERIVFKYGDKEDPIGFGSICGDIQGNTLAAEPDNKKIHIINAKGNRVRYLFTQESLETHPGIIALFVNTLWIGTFDNRNIEVYKYAN